ncbi:uncharacterized protein PG986_000410 [Apiospora aurea]|uniref:Uncharacterized protein n=1 Tax=Apiospora aurea TaxID=335848 RepID=A0ABR1QTZ2_9PEZI
MGETKESAEDPFKGDGTDWTWLYVIIFLIPVIFLAIAVYSTWRDRRAAATKARNDLETGRAAKLDRYYHPWRYDAAAGEAESSSAAAAGRKGANRSELTIVTAATTTATTTTTTAESSAAAGTTTSRHPNNPWEPAAPRSGGGSNNNMNNRRNHDSLTPVTPRSRYSTNPYRPQEYQQQQHQQESSSNQDVDAAPYPTSSHGAHCMSHLERRYSGNGSSSQEAGYSQIPTTDLGTHSRTGGPPGVHGRFLSIPCAPAAFNNLIMPPIFRKTGRT